MAPYVPMPPGHEAVGDMKPSQATSRGH
jgi:hypothetical protein